ncbi:type II secretion system protein N [Arhodomonas sp. AD133]|uniref:type II secretion system protein N n=1 Tax=Arhodomonas sp. AD133 TaxID=3415009 RepID=UPI003EB6E866
MKRWLRIVVLVVAFLLVYAASLAATLPADVAWHLAGDRVPARAYGLHGNLWTGGAEAVTVRGHRVDGLTWQLHPAALLTGKAHLSAKARTPDGELSGDVTLSASRAVTVSDARGNIDVDTLLAWIRRTGLAAFADGRVDAVVRSLRLENRQLVSADGLVTWQNARVRLGDEHALGNLALRLTPHEGGGVRGELRGDGGPLALGGTVTLTPDGDFEARLTVQPREEAATAGRRLARTLGLANPEGTTVVEASGNVSGQGLRLTQRPG